jgi:hypothetical protein
LETEFGESSNAIRLELNRFEEAGLLISTTEGNKKIYQANKSHSVFGDLHNLLIKFVGIDEIIERVLRRIGDLHSAYITGDFAKGIDSTEIELLLVGNQLDNQYISGLVSKAEGMIKRQIKLSAISQSELPLFLSKTRALLIWQGDTNGSIVNHNSITV